MATKKETLFCNRCVRHMKQLRKNGEPINWLNVHGGACQRAGEPDLLITYHGHSGAVELKVDDNQPTPIQLERLRRWSEAGATIAVVWTFAEFLSALDTMKKSVA
jgi:hypothetical protein